MLWLQTGALMEGGVVRAVALVWQGMNIGYPITIRSL